MENLSPNVMGKYINRIEKSLGLNAQVVFLISNLKF